MIRWLENPGLLAPETVMGHPCMNVIIRCGLRASGPNLGRDFWLQTQSDGRPSGWIMESGRHAWATVSSPHDLPAVREMADFFLARGFLRLKTEEAVAKAMKLPYTRLAVMGCTAAPEKGPDEAFEVRPASPKELTRVLVEWEELGKEAAEAFYAARHLHLRRGSETPFLGYVNGNPAACGVIAWGGGPEAILSCITVAPPLRRQGLGLAMTHALADRVFAAGHLPFLTCRCERIPFYQKADFKLSSWCAVLFHTTE